jgi:iron-sulfur cluster assembly protein
MTAPKLMTLTDAAAERIRALMTASGKDATGLRIGVKKGGCAGMEYTMSYAEAKTPHDDGVEDKGVRILVDPTAVLFLPGTDMDYHTDHASASCSTARTRRRACGCGEVRVAPPGGGQPEGAPRRLALSPFLARGLLRALLASRRRTGV